MSNLVQLILQQQPSADAQAIERFLAHWGEDYQQNFEPGRIAQHYQLISQLSKDNSVVVHVECETTEDWLITIATYDQAYLFSILCGVLASTGFDIQSGIINTSQDSSNREEAGPRSTSRHQRDFRRPGQRNIGRSSGRAGIDQSRQVIDVFRGRLSSGVDANEWPDRVKRWLIEAVSQLHQDQGQENKTAVRLVNERVTRWLQRQSAAAAETVQPFDLTIEQQEHGNEMTITGQDTPAFLYMLGMSMSLLGLSIRQVGITTQGRWVRDVVQFVSNQGKVITDKEKLDRIRFAVLLTKHFGYHLFSAPDPLAALQRFEQICRDQLGGEIEQYFSKLLETPRSMARLARVLGASDYLFEDFIRAHAEALQPLFDTVTNDSVAGFDLTNMRERLRQRLDGAVGLAQIMDRINNFKNDELYRIDVDQITNPNTTFTEFSEHLTQLADLLLQTAVEAVYQDLVTSFGQPEVKNHTCGYALFALGKLGGRALGYASDIEILMVYEGTGQTTGGKRQGISNSEFFITLMQDLTRYLKTKREGIFEIDLRLRPYGKEGPLACTLRHFREYYAKGGQAHDVERIAMVRLRPLMGDEKLIKSVLNERDEFLFQSGSIDPAANWELRRKQYQQKVSGQKANVKYACGGLVDLEYATQLLQIKHGARVPSLRMTGTYELIDEFLAGGILNPTQATFLHDAYRYFREVINGLRMLRGNAKDLVLPERDSYEAQHLARRVGYEADGWLDADTRLRIDFARLTAVTRQFVVGFFGSEALADEKEITAVDEHARQLWQQREGQTNHDDAHTTAWALQVAAVAEICESELDEKQLQQIIQLVRQAFGHEMDRLTDLCTLSDMSYWLQPAIWMLLQSDELRQSFQSQKQLQKAIFQTLKQGPDESCPDLKALIEKHIN